MELRHLYDLARKAVLAWVDDMAPSMGAAIAYYTMFSLAPLLVIVIAIAGAVFGRDAVQGQIVAQLGGLIGHDSAAAVQDLVRSASEPGRGWAAGIIGAIVLLIGATSVFAELQSALDRIWHVPQQDKPTGIWAIVKARLLSFGLILGLAFLLMVSLVTSAAVAAFGSWAGGLLPGSEVLLQLLNLVVSLGISCLLFAMIFKLMPTARVAWTDVWIGSVVTALLFEVGKLLIGLYIGKSGLSQTFAAAGSVVVVLAWVYYAAQIFLLGAEFTKVYASEHGSATGHKAMTATRITAAQAAAGTAHPQAVAALQVAAGQDAEAMSASIPAPRPIPSSPVTATESELDRRVRTLSDSLFRRLLVLGAVSAAEFVLQRWRDGRHKRAQSGKASTWTSPLRPK